MFLAQNVKPGMGWNETFLKHMKTDIGNFANVFAIIFLAIPVISIYVVKLTSEVAFTIKINSFPYVGKTCLRAIGKIIL